MIENNKRLVRTWLELKKDSALPLVKKEIMADQHKTIDPAIIKSVFPRNNFEDNPEEINNTERMTFANPRM